MNSSTERAARHDAGVELLDAAAVRDALDARAAAWLCDLDIRQSIDSTNTALLARAQTASIAGCVLTAETQTGGRGRRGRTWVSPFGRNLAVSLGVGSARPAKELGTLSLVVGLAVRSALSHHGLSGVELKWPNDVLLHGRKLAGILIELVRATPPVEVVVGIGINVGGQHMVAAEVDQTIADVTEQVTPPARNRLLAGVINHVVASCSRFEAGGFAPFRSQWQDAHRYQDAPVTVTLPGGERVSGTVVGIGHDGALRVASASGVREFNGGEVTVREA